jgi:hypothetical protein
METSAAERREHRVQQTPLMVPSRGGTKHRKSSHGKCQPDRTTLEDAVRQMHRGLPPKAERHSSQKPQAGRSFTRDHAVRLAEPL